MPLLPEDEQKKRAYCADFEVYDQSKCQNLSNATVDIYIGVK